MERLEPSQRRGESERSGGGRAELKLRPPMRSQAGGTPAVQNAGRPFVARRSGLLRVSILIGY
jgi:hypothetical protein